jgi:hypothetical protein
MGFCGGLYGWDTGCSTDGRPATVDRCFQGFFRVFLGVFSGFSSGVCKGIFTGFF